LGWKLTRNGHSRRVDLKPRPDLGISPVSLSFYFLVVTSLVGVCFGIPLRELLLEGRSYRGSLLDPFYLVEEPSYSVELVGIITAGPGGYGGSADLSRYLSKESSVRLSLESMVTSSASSQSS
jgi:hypothetical protein